MKMPIFPFMRVALPVLIVLFFFLLVVMLQWYAGAFSSEFGGYSDEPAHVINGLLVRDYLVSNQLLSPVLFAEDYYLHYPKVSLGHWPPMFYIIQALWTLLFSVGRSPLLLLMAAMASLVGLTLFLFLRRQFSIPIALAGGVLFLLLPLTQRYASMVMAEIPLTMFFLWSVLAFGRYLETEKWQPALFFGVFAGLALLTKGSALSLAAVPILSLVLTRKWILMKRWSFWLGAFVVVILCGPWYWLTKGMVQGTWVQPLPSISFAWTALRFYTSHLVRIPSLILFPLVLLGIYVMLLHPLRCSKIQGSWAAFAAAIIGTLMINISIPAGYEDRFLLPTLPLLILFFAAGIHRLLNIKRLFTTSRHTTRALVLTSLVMGLFLVTGFQVPRQSFHGYAEAATVVMSQSEHKDDPVLISSDELGEGAFIAEMAMNENRPGHFIVRSSKVLCRSNWLGTEYEPLFFDPKTLEAYLNTIPIRIIVEDESIPSDHRLGYEDLLKEMLRLNPRSWMLIGSCSVNRRGQNFHDALHIYRLIAAHKNVPVKLKIPVPLLKKSLQSK
jgi:4-amino-4-deoxy-L-arabinose transferase-like glycosyltransferase